MLSSGEIYKIVFSVISTFTLRYDMVAFNIAVFKLSVVSIVN